MQVLDFELVIGQSVVQGHDEKRILTHCFCCKCAVLIFLDAAVVDMTDLVDEGYRLAPVDVIFFEGDISVSAVCLVIGFREDFHSFK